VQADADRVRDISAGLGDDASVSVAADGRFDLGTATALAHFFEDQGVDLFEDPIPAADAPGYAKLAAALDVPLAVGAALNSRDDFFRIIRAGDVRTVRPDPCRLGGITPVLKVAAVAEAFQVSGAAGADAGGHASMPGWVSMLMLSVPYLAGAFGGLLTARAAAHPGP